MHINRTALSRFLKSSWIGIFSLVCTRELASPTKMARAQPPRKNAEGLPQLPETRALSFFQPSELQKGASSRTLRVMYRKKKTAAYHRMFVPKVNCGLFSR